jgi:hypothetical protein
MSTLESPPPGGRAARWLVIVAMVLGFPWVWVLSLFVFALMGISGWWFLLPPIGLFTLLWLA